MAKTQPESDATMTTTDAVPAAPAGHEQEGDVPAVSMEVRAVWSTAFINDLPDASFALIEAGGERDAEGKTTPRTLRHLPYKDAQGKVDLPHLRNALARLPQTELSAGDKAKAQKVLDAAAKKAGVEVQRAATAAPHGKANSGSASNESAETDADVDAPLTRAASALTSAQMWAPITRVDTETREVEGVLSSEDVDTYGTVFEYDAMVRAAEEWAGNVREQHDPKKAVGRRVLLSPDPERRQVWLRARISRGAEDTWQKVLDGTLAGFSIGAYDGKSERRMAAGGKMVPWYTDFKLAEVSLVDAPSNPAAAQSGLVIYRGTGFTDEALHDLEDLDEDAAATPPSSDTAVETPVDGEAMERAKSASASPSEPTQAEAVPVPASDPAQQIAPDATPEPSPAPESEPAPQQQVGDVPDKHIHHEPPVLRTSAFERVGAQRRTAIAGNGGAPLAGVGTAGALPATQVPLSPLTDADFAPTAEPTSAPETVRAMGYDAAPGSAADAPATTESQKAVARAEQAIAGDTGLHTHAHPHRDDYSPVHMHSHQHEHLDGTVHAHEHMHNHAHHDHSGEEHTHEHLHGHDHEHNYRVAGGQRMFGFKVAAADYPTAARMALAGPESRAVNADPAIGADEATPTTVALAGADAPVGTSPAATAATSASVSAPSSRAALHGPFTGKHSHPHSAMGDQGDDATHEHVHEHDGDALHDHDHAHGEDVGDEAGSGSKGKGNPDDAAHSSGESDENAGQHDWKSDETAEHDAEAAKGRKARAAGALAAVVEAPDEELTREGRRISAQTMQKLHAARDAQLDACGCQECQDMLMLAMETDPDLDGDDDTTPEGDLDGDYAGAEEDGDSEEGEGSEERAVHAVQQRARAHTRRQSRLQRVHTARATRAVMHSEVQRAIAPLVDRLNRIAARLATVPQTQTAPTAPEESRAVMSQLDGLRSALAEVAGQVAQIAAQPQGGGPVLYGAATREPLAGSTPPEQQPVDQATLQRTLRAVGIALTPEQQIAAAARLAGIERQARGW